MRSNVIKIEMLSARRERVRAGTRWPSRRTPLRASVEKSGSYVLEGFSAARREAEANWREITVVPR